MDPQQFIQIMNGWRSTFFFGSNWPVLGVSDAVLSRFDVPTAIVPFDDQLHPAELGVHANRVVADSRLFDYEPERREESRDQTIVASIYCDFAAGVL